MLQAILISAALGAGPKPKDVPKADIERIAKACDMTPEQLLKFSASCEARRLQRMDELSMEISRASGNTRKALIATRKRIKDRLEVAYPEMEGLGVDTIGSLPGGRYTFEQIIDDTTCLAHVKSFKILGPGSSWRIDSTILLRGPSTKGFADDSGTATTDCFRVTGTQTYDTVIGGTRTVRVLEPFDIAPIAEYCRLAYGK